MNFVEITQTISDYVWGWPMIILLLGTHIFLTFRLRVPQRKIFTAIKLSVTKDKDSTGDVSQFAGSCHFAGSDHRHGQHHWRGNGGVARRTWCGAMVLAHRRLWHRHKI